jgi:hypothetical protein
LLLLYPTYSTARIVGTDIAHAVPLTLVAGTGHWLTGCVDAVVPAYGINSRNRTWQLPGAPHPRAGFAISLGHRSHGRWNQPPTTSFAKTRCKRIFEMVEAVGAASHAEVLGSRKGPQTRHASS